MKLICRISNMAMLLLLLIGIVTVTGCNKFLDTDAQGSYNETNFPYPGGSGPYDQFIFAAYNDLRSFDVHSQSFIAATSIRSDDADKGSTAADGGAAASDMDNFPVQPSSSYCNTLWVGYYALINKCNITISQVVNNLSITASDQVKVQTIAEAKFLRAYGYFNLVRFFGRVPLVDTGSSTTGNIPQSSAAQIYAFIESDLTYAAANLPASWEAKFIGRGTHGAANGLLAKVYLTQQKWAQAMATAQVVINSGKYGFAVPSGGLTSYDFEFREEGENSKESIFEVQATASSTTPTSNGVQYASIQGVRGSGSWDLGWGWNTPSTYLEAAYEANDPRKARTILYTSTGSKSIYGESLPTGLPNPRYNNKVYSNPSVRSSVGNRFGYWMNIRILRYADVVLMYAEAANEIGGTTNTTAALNALNSVRARARSGAPAGTLPDVTTTDQNTLRDAIRQERRVELAMEHERFFDIVRWGIAQTVLNGAGKTNFSGSRDALLPIPLTQIDLSAGVLTQNPGY